MQMLSLVAAVLALASAFFLYGINYETRQLEARVNAQERVAAEARSDIAILKAERAHLARPDRIEPLARAQGLGPLRDGQMARDRNMDSLTTGSTPR